MGNISTYSSPDEGSFTYTYDNAGNILTANNTASTHTYTYGNANWKDLLTAFDGQTISYDVSGNPTSYYNGTRWTFTWENGRELTTATDGTTNISCDYDANGLRTQKTVDGVTHTYYYSNDGKLLRETYDTHILDFFYNPDGTPHALRYNGTYFYYVTNLQGDVIRIVDTDGETVCEYQYDPYGNILSKTATEIRIEISSADDDSSDIFEDLKDLMEDMGNIDIPEDSEILELSVDLGEINPLRYRGYYYDTETGMYYLQSRYYDSQVGRFINADAFASSGQGFIGCNMFAYCNNNPVRYHDIQGYLCAEHAGLGGGPTDYIIYYHHPESDKNLDGPAKRNHSPSNSKFIDVSSFDELSNAMNNIPWYTKNVYIYLHGDENDLSFYYDLNYPAGDIEANFKPVLIYGDIYLFSCKGGSGDLASAIANSTNCTVIASEYKVSFDDGAARCGWWDYWTHKYKVGDYTWYKINPAGVKKPYSPWFIQTK